MGNSAKSRNWNRKPLAMDQQLIAISLRILWQGFPSQELLLQPRHKGKPLAMEAGGGRRRSSFTSLCIEFTWNVSLLCLLYLCSHKWQLYLISLCFNFMCLVSLLTRAALYSHLWQLYFTPLCIKLIWMLRLFCVVVLCSHRWQLYLIPTKSQRHCHYTSIYLYERNQIAAHKVIFSSSSPFTLLSEYISTRMTDPASG